MAWVTPGTKVLGDLITYTVWDQDVVANTLALYDGMNVLSRCVAVKTTDQTISDVGGGTDVKWEDADTVDTDAYHNPASNPTNFYAPVAGQYLVMCRLDMSGNTVLSFMVNGAVPAPNRRSLTSTSPRLTAIFTLAADSYVTARGLGSGSAKTLNDGTLSITLISGGGLTGLL